MDRRTLAAFRDELEKISQVDPVLVGTGIGALTAFGAQALMNRAPKGGKSAQQRMFEANERHVNADRKAHKGFASEIQRITAKPMRQLADLAAKHPIKAALPAASVGAAAGAAIARSLL